MDENNGKTLYKVLVDGKSCHSGKAIKWKLGKWQKAEGDLKICENGLHLTITPMNWWKPGCTIYEAEAYGIEAWEKDKCVARKARIIRKLTKEEQAALIPYQSKLEEFIKEVKTTKYFKPDGKPKKEWKIFYADDWVAARDAARDAAWDAAGDAAWGAVWDAAGYAAWGAARDATRDAALVAARDAAWVAARDAAWVAARDAARDAEYIVVDSLDFKDKEKHKAHIKARWEVWRKGYGLLCDVNGVLYVYCKGRPPKNPGDVALLPKTYTQLKRRRRDGASESRSYAPIGEVVI